jgi:hypothetical protein
MADQGRKEVRDKVSSQIHSFSLPDDSQVAVQAVGQSALSRH